jgi:hypothetical protein
MVISGLSRGFSTCCLRFTNGVATIHARLASGWLARLYREGVEPSGSQRRVSDHIILPPWTFPGATSENLHNNRRPCFGLATRFPLASATSVIGSPCRRPMAGKTGPESPRQLSEKRQRPAVTSQIGTRVRRRR